MVDFDNLYGYRYIRNSGIVDIDLEVYQKVDKLFKSLFDKRFEVYQL